MASLKKSTGRFWLVFALVLAGVYFGNVELQSYWGRQALAKVQLDSKPLEQALKIARAQNKLVLADMSAIWCPTCRKLDQQVFADQQVKEAVGKRYIFSRIEYESPEGKAFAERYRVSGFPTVLILDAEGKMLRRLPLTFDPQNFIHLISQVGRSQSL